MSAAKHTPGPWRAEPCRCEPGCKRWIISVPQNTDGRFDEADAKLITAAPEQQANIDALLAENTRMETLVVQLVDHAVEVRCDCGAMVWLPDDGRLPSHKDKYETPCTAAGQLWRDVVEQAASDNRANRRL